MKKASESVKGSSENRPVSQGKTAPKASAKVRNDGQESKPANEWLRTIKAELPDEETWFRLAVLAEGANQERVAGALIRTAMKLPNLDSIIREETARFEKALAGTSPASPAQEAAAADAAWEAKTAARWRHAWVTMADEFSNLEGDWNPVEFCRFMSGVVGVFAPELAKMLAMRPAVSDFDREHLCLAIEYARELTLFADWRASHAAGDVVTCYQLNNSRQVIYAARNLGTTLAFALSNLTDEIKEAIVLPGRPDHVLPLAQALVMAEIFIEGEGAVTDRKEGSLERTRAQKMVTVIHAGIVRDQQPH